MHPPRAVVQLKGHGFEVYGDTLRLSKKVEPKIAVKPLAFGSLQSVKDLGWLKDNEHPAEFQHHFWYGCNTKLLTPTRPHYRARSATA